MRRLRWVESVRLSSGLSCARLEVGEQKADIYFRGGIGRYGVILDAGSSGTRVHIYRWLDPLKARKQATVEQLNSLPVERQSFSCPTATYTFKLFPEKQKDYMGGSRPTTSWAGSTRPRNMITGRVTIHMAFWTWEEHLHRLHLPPTLPKPRNMRKT